MNTDLSLVILIAEASLLVQGVMAVLLLFSILSWTIIFQRGVALWKAKKWLNAFEQRFEGHYDLNQLYQYLAGKRHMVVGIEQIFKSGLREFLKLYQKDALPQVVMQGTDRVLNTELSKEERNLETHLPFLATVASISVYVGLFGTVWGIMSAFRALGTVQQATLAMVAPGIAEALIATALGLFAAIPAAYAYNRYTHRVHDLMRRYDFLADEFATVLHNKLYTAESETVENAPESNILR